MPITPTCTRKGPYSWLYEWSGTAPFDVYKSGAKVLDQSTKTSLVVQATNTHTPPAIEIFDDDDTTTPQSVTYSPLMRMQWRGQTDAALYLIQEYVDSAWVTRQVMLENGSGYYRHTTTALPDQTASQWQVVPQDSRGYQGDAVPFTYTITCNPEPPQVAYSYDEGTTTLTVSAVS